MGIAEGDTTTTCPNFDGKKWGCKGACRIVRNWQVRGSAPSNCTLQDQNDFADYHGPIYGVTENCGPHHDTITTNNQRLDGCCCPLVTRDAGANRELRSVRSKLQRLKNLIE